MNRPPLSHILSPPLQKPAPAYPGQKKNRQCHGRQEGPEGVGLHLPKKVESPQKSCWIHKAVKPLPSLPEPPNPTFGRCDGKRQEKEECAKPGGDKGTLCHILPDVRPGESLIESQVKKEVEGGIEERKEAHQPPNLDDLIPTSEAPKGCDGKACQEEDQSAPPSPVKECLDGVGSQAT